MTPEAYSGPPIEQASPAEVYIGSKPLLSVNLYHAIRSLPIPASSVTDLPRDADGNIVPEQLAQRASQHTEAHPFFLTPSEGTNVYEFDAISRAQLLAEGRIRVITPEEDQRLHARRTQLMGDFTDELTYGRNGQAGTVLSHYFQELGTRPKLMFDEYWTYGLRPEDTGNIARLGSPNNHYWKNFNAVGDPLRQAKILLSAEKAEDEGAPAHRTAVRDIAARNPHQNLTFPYAQDLVRLGSMDNARAGIFYTIQGVAQRNPSRRLMAVVARPALEKVAQSRR